MLVIKIEFWPDGDHARAREIGRMGIANVSNLAANSDYVAALQDNTGHESSVFISQHEREIGFWPLLARAAASVTTLPRARRSVPARWQPVAAAVAERMSGLPPPRHRP